MDSSPKFPNPQGKGLSPVLESLRQAKTQLSVPAKNIDRISNELFTSLFILNSQIRFKPVSGQGYWLYRKNGRYNLSLIAPEQWSTHQYGRYIGRCELQADLTWTLRLSGQCLNDPALIDEIKRRRERFENSMQRAERIDDLLPVYIETLPFYSRALASALAHSLKQSMQKGGISGLNFNQARRILTQQHEENPTEK
ncbi:DUF2452 domain-containing protein [Methylomarinum sp. Ch1-1]|uniref:DUF2452 domain-containing protein n=1 Tax=Methylomarinum roseum TaxID=3067653 RepID=A0AAU7NZ52_9GAMM|nr:DUF2452 domain-containing protein [Methylomarinum sp. Ch1-1]MDP4521596.1 DUF2452 domain-containing protein [Methylomarinum sp. Ch1-1]